MFSVKAKKNFGQHFLKDENIANRVADTLNDFPTLPVMEVGAGTGMLTKFLLKRRSTLKLLKLIMSI